MQCSSTRCCNVLPVFHALDGFDGGFVVGQGRAQTGHNRHNGPVTHDVLHRHTKYFHWVFSTCCNFDWPSVWFFGVFHNLINVRQ